MFVVVDVKGGTSYFEVPGINKYSCVAVVSIENREPTHKTTFDADDNVDEDDRIDETGEEEE